MILLHFVRTLLGYIKHGLEFNQTKTEGEHIYIGCHTEILNREPFKPQLPIQIGTPTNLLSSYDMILVEMQTRNQ